MHNLFMQINLNVSLIYFANYYTAVALFGT